MRKYKFERSEALNENVQDSKKNLVELFDIAHVAAIYKFRILEDLQFLLMQRNEGSLGYLGMYDTKQTQIS